MMRNNDKKNRGAVTRAASALQSLEHRSPCLIIPIGADSLYPRNLGQVNSVLEGCQPHVARPYHIMVVGRDGSSVRTAVFYSTYFAQKRLQDTTGKANVDRAVEEQEDVAQAIEQRIQERRERKECVEELLLEDVSETRSLSLQFWKLQEFTEQLSSLSLSLNTFKLLKEIVREYKGIGECEGKGGNPQETQGVVLYQSPPVCCVEKPSLEIAAGITHQIQNGHKNQTQEKQTQEKQICSSPRVGGASSLGAKDTSGYPHNLRFPDNLEASDLINQASDEVEGLIRTRVGLYLLQEACGDLQGVRDALRAVPTPIEPSSDLYEASRSLVGALERREECGWSTLLLCTVCKPSGCR